MSSEEAGRNCMAGTEGTDEYTVIAHNGAGDRIGVRRLSSDGMVRVRIEPVNDESAVGLANSFTRGAGWKQPGDGSQPRFSIVVSGDSGIQVVELALQALAGDGSLQRNKAWAARVWRRLLASEENR